MEIVPLDWAMLAGPFILHTLKAVAVLLIGHWSAKFLSAILQRGLGKARVDPAIVAFASSISYYALLIFVLIIALAELGVNTTSLAAAVGAAGLAIGFALRDTLSNVAAGIVLVALRPFRIGDFIKAGGETGRVEEISVFQTVITRMDNCEVTIPNANVLSETITNFSRNHTRRIDLEISIAYQDDIEAARAVILETVSAHEKVLSSPGPTVNVLALADSGVTLAVRPWVRREDFRQTRFDLLEQVKSSLEKNGLTIPFPQRDVHVYEVGSARK